MAFTSIVVLLQIPLKVVLFFTLTCLGELSKLYKRVIIQNFDIEHETASMAVTLMSNSVTFLELSDCIVGTQKFPGISKARMGERMKAALQQRRDVLNDSELQAFVACCFESLVWDRGDQLHLSNQKQDETEEGIIDIDTFNLYSSMNHSVDLPTAVNLFDVDRKRRILESLFTPPAVHRALERVKDAGQESLQTEVLDEDEDLVEDPFEEDIEKQKAEPPLCSNTLQELKTIGVDVLPPSGSGSWAASNYRLQTLSLEERRLHDFDQKADFQRVRLIVSSLTDKVMEHEEAAKTQAGVIEALRDRTSTLEAELQTKMAIVQRLEGESSVEHSKWQTMLAVEKKRSEKQVESRMRELESQVNDRLTTALSNNGLAERSLSNSGMLSREGTDCSNNPGAKPRIALQLETDLQKLSNSLTVMDAELRRQNLAIKETLEKALEPLQAELGEQRKRWQILQGKLYEERARLECCDSRVDNLEAALALQVAGETPPWDEAVVPSQAAAAERTKRKGDSKFVPTGTVVPGSASKLQTRGLQQQRTASGSAQVREPAACMPLSSRLCS